MMMFEALDLVMTWQEAGDKRLPESEVTKFSDYMVSLGHK